MATVIGERVLKETEGLSRAHERVPAQYVALPSGQVVFRRFEGDGSVAETDLGPHAAFYERIFALDEQIKAKYGDGDGPAKGGPGLPGRQRAGLVMLEVTEKCNLTCPMCYAGSNPDGRHYTMTEIAQRLDEIVAAEGVDVSLQISGGEPSVRKDLKELAALITSKGFTNFEMISNGIRIARDADFAESLKAWGFTSVYLQWDSLREADIELLRGEKLLGVRLKALEQLEKAGLNTTLAVSLLPGLNTDQIGPILEICRQHPVIRAVSFQAATPFGNRWDVDEGHAGATGDTRGFGRKLRLPDILQLIEEQLGIAPEEFMPLGFGSPLCNSIAILRHDKKRGTWVPTTPGIEWNRYSRILGDDPVDFIRMVTRGKGALSKRLLSREGFAAMRVLLPYLGRNPGIMFDTQYVTVFIKPFMDAEDLDFDRVDRCCFHNASPRGLHSFCHLNALVRPTTAVDASAFGDVIMLPQPELVLADGD